MRFFIFLALISLLIVGCYSQEACFGYTDDNLACTYSYCESSTDCSTDCTDEAFFCTFYSGDFSCSNCCGNDGTCLDTCNCVQSCSIYDAVCLLNCLNCNTNSFTSSSNTVSYSTDTYSFSTKTSNTNSFSSTSTNSNNNNNNNSSSNANHLTYVTALFLITFALFL